MANRTIFDVSVESKVFGQKPSSSYRRLLDSLMNNLIEDPKTTSKVLGIKLKSQMNIKIFGIDNRKTMTIYGHTNTMNLAIINRNIEKILDALITPSGEKYTIKNYTLQSLTDDEYSKFYESETLTHILDTTGLRGAFLDDFNAMMEKLPFMYSAKSSMSTILLPTNDDTLRLYFAEFGFMELAHREYLLPMPEGYIRCKVKDYDFDTGDIHVELFNSMEADSPSASIRCQLTDCIDLAVIVDGFYDNPMLPILKDIQLKVGRYWSPFVVNNRFYGYRSNNGKKTFVIPTFKETEFKENFYRFSAIDTVQNYPVAYYKNGKFKKFIDFEEFTYHLFELCKKKESAASVNEPIVDSTIPEDMSLEVVSEHLDLED